MCVSDHCLVSSLFSPVSLKLLADFRQRDNDVPPGFTVMQRGKKPSKASLKKDFIVSSESPGGFQPLLNAWAEAKLQVKQSGMGNRSRKNQGSLFLVFACHLVRTSSPNGRQSVVVQKCICLVLLPSEVVHTGPLVQSNWRAYSAWKLSRQTCLMKQQVLCSVIKWHSLFCSPFLCSLKGISL